MRTLPRSVGFNFRDSLFQATLLQDDKGQNDAHCFYADIEYESLQKFFDSVRPTKDEQDAFLETLNKLIKQP
jgi:hypothetical protein